MRDAAVDPDNFSDVLREVITQDSIWASHFYNPYTGRTYTGSDSNAPSFDDTKNHGDFERDTATSVIQAL